MKRRKTESPESDADHRTDNKSIDCSINDAFNTAIQDESLQLDDEIIAATPKPEPNQTLNKENRRRKQKLTLKKQIKHETETDIFEPEKESNDKSCEAIIIKSPLKCTNTVSPVVSPPREKFHQIISSETPKWISKKKTPSKQLFNKSTFLQPENPSPAPVFKAKSPYNLLSSLSLTKKHLRQSRLEFPVKLGSKQDDVSLYQF